MIIATFEKNDDKFSSYSLSGHAGFAEPGKDIVCAAVSALYTTTTNALTDYVELTELKKLYGENGIYIQTYSDVTEALIKSFYDGLIEIEKQYPENVKVEVIR